MLDCAGGDDVPRKGGPGVSRADLLVINKTDLAPLVGVSVPRMVRDAAVQRGARPIAAVCLRDRATIAPVLDWVRDQVALWRDGELVSVDPGPPAPHGHHHSH